MSRYIRTRDGIHSVDAVLLRSGRIRYSLSNVDNLISKEDLEEITIREAKTIEELCDEFVCEWFDKEVNRYRHVYCSFKIGQSKELYRRDIPLPANVDFEIYAGIWVNNKGLIYVAKMNENGELGLI